MTVHNGEPHSETDERDETLRLYEEELVAHKEWRAVGDVVIRTEIVEEPSRVQVEATREDIEVEHVPVGEVVEQREGPREEDDAIVIPVYEEQIVVEKRLYLREYLRVRRFRTTETRSFNGTVRREKAKIDAPPDKDVVRERYPRRDR
jgi:uncharacterized protein (TIGR02271 family)